MPLRHPRRATRAPALLLLLARIACAAADTPCPGVPRPFVRELPYAAASAAAAAAVDARGCVLRSNVSIAFVHHGSAANSIFWRTVEDGARRAALDLGVNLVLRTTPSFDLAGMSALIDEAVAARPDGLVVSLPNVAALAPAVRRAVASGVVVIAINSGVHDFEALGAVHFVGQAEHAAGYEACGRLLAAGARRVLTLDHRAGLAAGVNERHDGCAARALELGGSAHKVHTTTTEEVALADVRAALDADPALDAVLALSSATVVPAARAVAELPPTRPVLLGSFDFSAEMSAMLESGELLFAVDQQQYLQGTLPLHLLAARASSAHLPLPPREADGGAGPIVTGPSFVTAGAHAERKACEAQGVFYCAEPSTSLAAAPAPGCPCIERGAVRLALVLHVESALRDASSLWSQLVNGAELAAADRGVSLDVLSPARTDSAAMAELLLAAARDAQPPYDGIVSTAPGAALLAPAFDAARARGTRVVTLFSRDGFEARDPALREAQLLHVGQDDEAAGFEGARAALALGDADGNGTSAAPGCGGGGAAALLVIDHGLGTSPELNARVAGVRRYANTSSAVPPVRVELVPLDAQNAARASQQLDAALDALGGAPCVRAVLALGEPGTHALLGAGRLAGVPAGAFDPDAEALAALADGRLAFALDQQPWLQGHAAVAVAAEAALSGNAPVGPRVLPAGPRVLWAGGEAAMAAVAAASANDSAVVEWRAAPELSARLACEARRFDDGSASGAVVGWEWCPAPAADADGGEGEGGGGGGGEGAAGAAASGAAAPAAVQSAGPEILIVAVFALAGIAGVAVGGLLLLGAARLYSLARQALGARRAQEAQLRARVEGAMHGVLDVLYPVALVPLPTLRTWATLLEHERALDGGCLVLLHTYEQAKRFVTRRPTVFLSHQWLAWGAPDPEGEHLRHMVAAVLALCEAEELVEEDVYCWIDIVSIPQHNKATQALAVRALGVYASMMRYFIAVCPPCTHAETRMPCDLRSYGTRGWCRLEQWAHLAVAGVANLYVSDASGTLRSVDEDWVRESILVFEGTFTLERDRFKLVDVVLGLWALTLVARRAGYGGAEEMAETVDDLRARVFPSALFGQLVERLEAEVRVRFDEWAAAHAPHLAPDGRARASSSARASGRARSTAAGHAARFSVHVTRFSVGGAALGVGGGKGRSRRLRSMPVHAAEGLAGSEPGSFSGDMRASEPEPSHTRLSAGSERGNTPPALTTQMSGALRPLSDEELADARDAFRLMDTGARGELSWDGFERTLRMLGLGALPQQDARAIFEQRAPGGTVDFDAFTELVLCARRKVLSMPQDEGDDLLASELHGRSIIHQLLETVRVTSTEQFRRTSSHYSASTRKSGRRGLSGGSSSSHRPPCRGSAALSAVSSEYSADWGGVVHAAGLTGDDGAPLERGQHGGVVRLEAVAASPSGAEEHGGGGGGGGGGLAGVDIVREIATPTAAAADGL